MAGLSDAEVSRRAKDKSLSKKGTDIKRKKKPEHCEINKKGKVIIKRGSLKMKFKNVNEKRRFIDSLEKMDNQSIREIIDIIDLLASDKNIDVRRILAKQMVIFDCDEVEDILYGMLDDKNRMVRLEAVDSLSVGRHEESIKKVAAMLVKEGCMIRMYAVTTLFNLITNAYGMNERAFEKYNLIVKSSFQAEKNQRVLLAYYQNEYYMQPKKGILLLKEIYTDILDNEKYDLVWTILHILSEIRSRNNNSEIQQILEYKAEKLLPVQKEFADVMRVENVPYKILILDEDNTFLSHVVALKIRSMCSKMDITLSTAGIDTGILRFNEIRACCKKNGIFCPEKLYAKRVTEVYAYDYIVCLNIMQNQDMYSKIRTVHYKDIDIQSDEQVQLICKDIQKQLISLKI